MLRRQAIILLGFLVVLGGLGWGLVRLFTLRLEHGDSYAAYSTLRADPRGAKVLFHALGELPGMQVERNFQPLPHLPAERPVGLFYLDLSSTAIWRERELEHFETMLTRGSRAVFAFHEEKLLSGKGEDIRAAAAKRARATWRTQHGRSGEKEDDAPSDEELYGAHTASFVSVADEWGFRFVTLRRERSSAPLPPVATREADVPDLEPTIPWRSALHFTELKGPWKVLYRYEGEPVVIERPWGTGSVVLAADTFFLGNEALREESRASRLLAHLVGAQRHLVFDEEHLGITEQSGVATLARKYHLHGLVAALLLVAALFLWQNLVRFLPPVEESATATVAGRGQGEGILSLLRRSVPASELLPTALATYRKHFAHDPRALAQLEAIVPPGAELPDHNAEILALYGRLVEALGPPAGARKLAFPTSPV